MSAEQLLEKYISEHPDYWEFENEANVVVTLKELCKSNNLKPNNSTAQNPQLHLFN